MEAQTILTTYVDFLFIDRPGSCRGERERESITGIRDTTVQLGLFNLDILLEH